MFPLVTLITPCHNGEAHLEPYLRGILSQTYPNVQFIFINDGSTDKTEAMILSEENKIRAKGWDFIYVSRHHSGQAAAMNIAIPLIKGKYFSQIDSDDIIEPQYLEKYCYFLEKNPVYKFCYARIAIRRENESSPYQIRYRHATPNRQDNFFNDLIYEQNVPPLSFYMCETEAFNSVVKHPIYEGAGGQNWQILLPMAYFYQCGYLDDILATYIERDSSHSHREQKRNDRITVILPKRSSVYG